MSSHRFSQVHFQTTGHASAADPQDLFADTRMSFGDHLEELRWRLWRAVGGFGIIFFLVVTLDFIGYATGTIIGVAKPVKDFIAAPVEQELQKFYRRRVAKVLARLDEDQELRNVNQPTSFVLMGFYRAQLLAMFQGKPPSLVNKFPRPRLKAQPPDTAAENTVEIEDADIVRLWVRHEEPLRDAAYRQEAERQVGRRPTLATMSLMEGMTVYLQVAMACGIVLGSPWIAWQLWAFVASGLYPHERRPIYFYLPISLALLVTGILACQLWVIPKAIETLLGFNEWLDFEPDLRLTEWLGFAVWMPLIFGLSFQTPLVMSLLERLGLVTIAAYRSKRRLAWFVLAIFAAIMTPPFDILSMMFLWVPLGVLYEMGVLLCVWSRRQRQGPGVDVGVFADTTEI